jgi:uncharacterized membrane protein
MAVMANAPQRTLKAAGLAIGIGMGGFVDGIVFHQILQVHNMLSARIANDNIVGAKVNMVWDGFFHVFTWIMVAIGIALLWKAAKTRGTLLSTSTFAGSMLMGWGLFNVIEGVVDHHLLNVHHVVERMGQSIWDYAFLLWGALMVLGGWAWRRRDEHGAGTVR